MHENLRPCNSLTVVKLETIQIERTETKQIRETRSICPDCNKILPAAVYERDGKIWISKTCPDHGEIEELYFGSADMYYKFAKFSHNGKGIENPNVPLEKCACPTNCGLCTSHLSHSGLTNLVITNRCDLTCWYCFFYAKKGVEGAYVYEPTQEKIREMVKVLRAERPVPGNAIQITGGEPTLRNDLEDIVRICREEGVEHIQLNSNGINMALDPTTARRVRLAGVNTVYMSFDGVTPRTNPKNHWEAPMAIQNCREAKLGVVLVPTVIKTINDHELGGLIRFGQRNMDVVHAVNFQPVSLTGRLSKSEREKYRITIPDCIERIEEQTNGEVTMDSWFPVPSCVPITHFVEALTKRPRYELSIHFACGAGTYVFKDGDKLVPIASFVDLEGMLEYLEEKADELKAGANKYLVIAKVLAKMGTFIDRSKQPKGLALSKLLFNALVKNDYNALRRIPPQVNVPRHDALHGQVQPRRRTTKTMRHTLPESGPKNHPILRIQRHPRMVQRRNSTQIRNPNRAMGERAQDYHRARALQGYTTQRQRATPQDAAAHSAPSTPPPLTY